MRKWQVLVFLIGASLLSSGLAGMKKANVRATGVNDLPYDCFGIVFEFLSVEDVVHFMFCSKASFKNVKACSERSYLSSFVVTMNYERSQKERLNERIRNSLFSKIRIVLVSSGYFKLRNVDLNEIEPSKKIVAFDFTKLTPYISFKLGLSRMPWGNFPNLKTVKFLDLGIKAKVVDNLADACKIKCLWLIFKTEKESNTKRKVNLLLEEIKWSKLKSLEWLRISVDNRTTKKRLSEILELIAGNCKLKRLDIYITCRDEDKNDFCDIDWEIFLKLELLHVSFLALTSNVSIENVKESCKKVTIFSFKGPVY